MQRRRLGMLAGLLFFGVLIAVKPPIGALRLSIGSASQNDVARVEAAVELGAFAVSILVAKAAEKAR